ncbi:ATP-binding cassette domain-containing protein [Amycolatopsis sp. YIM 10]|uniref:ATP-binding cassette domain-containing protein n=1 Tax=Amycolatopsis sp. YIM 10 TaxID=2653857 RepID=UPI0012905BAF|nr:ATP-binding cassette domain-containing protein [Amycolatopsis sp. YIM 10]QFU90581.1 Daunorubicin/doxorubicin resistance ATP-binding protein DrrA [Amycolatopsis sp. YIM 10]
MSAIDVQELGKVYPDGTAALDGLTFVVQPGEIFGYLGRNGAGKTTTVRVLATLTRPSSGRASVLGFDLTSHRDEVRRHVGLSLQQAALDELMTGREHLELATTLHRITGAAGRRRVDGLLEQFGLTGVASKLVATYTVGMRRRLDTAMALVHEPGLLFLDEPTTGLDPQSRRALWDFVRDYRAGGGTVFLTTQYLDEADELCDRIAILGQGRIAVLDTPRGLKHGIGGRVLTVLGATAEERGALAGLFGADRLRESGNRCEVDLSAREDELPELLAELRDRGLAPSRLALSEPTIEDVFVRLTGDRVDSGTTSGTAAGVAAIGRTIVTKREGGR